MSFVGEKHSKPTALVEDIFEWLQEMEFVLTQYQEIAQSFCSVLSQPAEVIGISEIYQTANFYASVGNHE